MEQGYFFGCFFTRSQINTFFGRFVDEFMKVKNHKILLKGRKFLILRSRLLEERVKDFTLRVFLRVKMLNILENLRVDHQ